MASSYTASDIEVLSGLDPVRRRPGMYTDTTRPNHLAHEVVDNSVDEAINGHCENIRVTVFKDGSLQVEDDGRGMPIDIHPKEKVPGVEVILDAHRADTPDGVTTMVRSAILFQHFNSAGQHRSRHLHHR